MFGIRVHSPGQIYQNNNLGNNGPRDVTPILQTVPIDGLVGLIISIWPVDIENVPHSRTDSGFRMLIIVGTVASVSRGRLLNESRHTFLCIS